MGLDEFFKATSRNQIAALVKTLLDKNVIKLEDLENAAYITRPDGPEKIRDEIKTKGD